MDSFEKKMIKPQFNVSLFNRNVILTMNRKFMEDLLSFLNGDKDIKDNYGDLCECIENHLRDENTQAAIEVGDDEEFSVASFRGMYNLVSSGEFAENLAKEILEKAGAICQGNHQLNLNAFVAFGRKLETAGQGNYEALGGVNKRQIMQPPVREIVIRREVVGPYSSPQRRNYNY